MAREFARKFYKSEEWKQVREYVLMRDKYLCQICGAPAEEVHHKEHLSPENIQDAKVNLNPKNLISLCRNCHFNQHRHDKKAGIQAAQEKKAGYHFDEHGFYVPNTPPVVQN